jgi:hypothetical protein
MAAPQVAGAAILVMTLAPTWTIHEVKQYLLDSAVRRDSLAGKSVSGGRLNIDRATLSPARVEIPVAGWRAGSNAHLEWREEFESCVCSHADISLSLDDGRTYAQTLGSRVALARRSLDVSLGDVATDSARVRFACPGTNIATTSAAFRIANRMRVLAPSAETVWRGGTSDEVSWTGSTNSTDAQCATVEIALAAGKEGYRRELAAAAPNTGKARVRVPFHSTPDAVVSVTCSMLGSGGATSAPFRITNPLPAYLGLLVLIALAW